MRHLLIMLALSACGEPFVFGSAGAGGDGGHGGEFGGGMAPTGGGGPSNSGGAGGAGGAPPECDEGARSCDGSWLLECLGGQWSYEVDCSTVADMCLLGRCEDDLVAFFRFEEGAGTTTTDLSTGYVGTITQSSWVGGAIGGGLELGEVSLGNVMNTLALPVSFAAWIRIDPGAPAAAMTILALDTSSGTPYAGAWLYLEGASGNVLSAWFGNATVYGPAGRHGKVSEVPIATGSWRHVGAVLRGPDDISIYLDGAEIAGTYSGTADTMAFTGAPAVLGTSRWGGTDLQYDGMLDELRVYGRELVEAEMTELANEQR